MRNRDKPDAAWPQSRRNPEQSASAGSERDVPARKTGLTRLWRIARWSAVAALAVFALFKYSNFVVVSREAGQRRAEMAFWEQKQRTLEEEIANYSDPEWRASYWKWRTMTHEPGEYYLRFYDPGSR